MSTNVALEGIVGSTAYGLATPESDIDKLGVFVARMDVLLGMQPGPETVVTNDPDSTLHEVRKYMSLAGKANPTVLELLYLNDYTTMTDIGKLLVDNRDAFLSQRIRKTYSGYAFQQIQRLERRGDGSFKSKLRKRKDKHKRHIARLVIQCEFALSFSRLKIRLNDFEIEQVREVEAMDDKELLVWFEEHDKNIRDWDTALPEDADWGRINDLLLQIRRMQ